MITGIQIRAARSALGWSGSDLAREANVSLRTISKIELSSGLPDARIATVARIKSAFEEAGIEFISAPGGAQGILLHSVKA